MTAIARVFVNNIEVGSLPAAEYDRLSSAAYGDQRLWAATFLSLLGAVWRILGRTVAAMPAVLLASAATMALVVPGPTAELVHALRALPPEQLFAGFLRVLSMVGTLGLVVVPMLDALRGRNPGDFVNPFDAAVANQIRQRLEVPSDGALRVEVERGAVTHPA
jgi:hypothetical protein